MNQTLSSAANAFSFDLDLSGDALSIEDRLQLAEKKLSAAIKSHQIQLVEARKQAEEAGRQSAEARAAEEIEKQVKVLAKHAATLISQRDSVRLSLEKDALDLAVTVGQYLAECALVRFPLAEIEGLLQSTISDLSSVPHLVLTLPDKSAARIKHRIIEILDENGFEGRLMIKTDAEFDISDIKIEWSEGELVRNKEMALASLREEITRFFEAKA